MYNILFAREEECVMSLGGGWEFMIGCGGDGKVCFVEEGACWEQIKQATSSYTLKSFLKNSVS
jgi:hypothetical protein